MRTRRAERALRAIGFAVGFVLAASGASLADARDKSAGPSYQARVVHIHDGDSLIVSDGERQRDLRIYEIDAPERGQPWGRRATQALARLVEGKLLRVEFINPDRYGREVSKLSVDGVCVACELVRGGHAWAYRKYLRNPELLELEREARAARLGLWGQPAHTFVPPWEWRQGARSVSAEAAALAALPAVAPGDSTAVACGAKRYCKEMSSCAEARFYLQRCGLGGVDGDGDGVPCETICR